MPISGKTVLITGCSEGGLGAAMAKVLHDQGYHVFATLRKTSKTGPLASLERVEVLELEVTSKESITRCVEHVRQRTGGTLDMLVNNAARSSVMPLLDVDIDDAKEMFDVNFWSILAVTQAFAPLLVQAKGVLVNHSSVASKVLVPWHGIYIASKAAVTQASELFRVELEPLGVRVVTVLIGAVYTQMRNNTRSEEFKLPSNSYFEPVRHFLLDERARIRLPESEPPEVTAQHVVNDILGGATGCIWRGGYATGAKWWTWLLPTWVLDRITTRGTGLEDLKNHYVWK